MTWVKIIFNLYKLFGLRILLLSSRVLSVSMLKKVVGKVMLEVEYSSGFFHDLKFQGFYRGRSHNHIQGNIKNDKLSVFTNEREFINPPPENVNIGRCNEKGESMFYCTTDLITAIVESRPEVNGFVTVASFEGLYDGRQFEHRISPVGYRYLRENTELSKMMGILNPRNRAQFTKVDDFLDRLFHMKIKKNTYYYKLSNAVAKCMIEDIENDIGTRMIKHGLVYSSILRNHASYNIVLKPFYVNYYKIKVLQTFKINEFSESSLKFSIVRRGSLNGVKKDPAENFNLLWEEIVQNKTTTLEYDLINSKYN